MRYHTRVGRRLPRFCFALFMETRHATRAPRNQLLSLACAAKGFFWGAPACLPAIACPILQVQERYIHEIVPAASLASGRRQVQSIVLLDMDGEPARCCCCTVRVLAVLLGVSAP